MTRKSKNELDRLSNLQLVTIKTFTKNKQFAKQIRNQLRKRGFYKSDPNFNYDQYVA